MQERKRARAKETNSEGEERKTKEKTKLSTCLKWKGFNRKRGGRKAHKLERFRVGPG